MDKGVEMSEELKENVSDKNTWLRLLFMILFAVVLGLSDLVLLVIVILQFGFVLFSRQKNDELLDFGAQLARFRYHVVRYLTYNTEDRPWPFVTWPDGHATGSHAATGPAPGTQAKKTARKKAARKKKKKTGGD